MVERVKCPHCGSMLREETVRDHIKKALADLARRLSANWDEEMEAAEALDENIRLKEEDEEWLSAVQWRLNSSNPEVVKAAKKSIKTVEHRLSKYEFNIKEVWKKEDKRLVAKRKQLESKKRKLMAWRP